MRHAVIRADATVRIASGHIMRCLTLADVLKTTFTDISITLLSGPLPNAISQRVTQAGVTLKLLSKNVDDADWTQSLDITQSIEAISSLPTADLIIVDHYALDHLWERSLSAHCDKLMVIDDLADRSHHANLLLDQTFGCSPEAYMPLVNSDCHLLLGSAYTLIREEFLALQQSALSKRQHFQKVEHLLINLGGLDEHNATGRIIDLIENALPQEQFEKLTFTVIASADAPHIQQLRERTESLPNAELILDCQHMAEQLLKADIAIGASGGSTWERCVMALPTLAVVLADNQITIATQLEKAGAIINLGEVNSLTKEKLALAFKQLDAPETYQEMVKHCQSICDGLGTKRVIDALFPSNVSLRKATEADLLTIFAWQANPDVRKFSRNPNPVSLEEHEQWFKHSLTLTTRFIYIISYGDKACGVLRLDEIDADNYEVSILVDPGMQGKGVALKALNQIPEQFSDRQIYAFVSPQNKASQKLFLKADFKQVSINEFIRKKNG